MIWFQVLNLPDINVYELCRMLKSDSSYKYILIYYLTAAPRDEVVLKVLETNADGFITKPFDLSDFNDLFDYLSK